MDSLANAAGHEDRHLPLKSYCKGLLLEGDRKSIEPMAARLAPDNVQPMRQSLHHLVAKAPWSDETILEEVRKQVLPAMQKQGPVVAWLGLGHFEGRNWRGFHHHATLCIAAADSGTIGPLIPVGSGPRFRWDLVHDSGGKWSSFSR